MANQKLIDTILGYNTSGHIYSRSIEGSALSSSKESAEAAHELSKSILASFAKKPADLPPRP